MLESIPPPTPPPRFSPSLTPPGEGSPIFFTDTDSDPDISPAVHRAEDAESNIGGEADSMTEGHDLNRDAQTNSSDSEPLAIPTAGQPEVEIPMRQGQSPEQRSSSGPADMDKASQAQEEHRR